MVPPRTLIATPPPHQVQVAWPRSAMAKEGRRSANYQHSIWDDEYIQSLTTPYSGAEYVAAAEKLKTQVKLVIDETKNELNQLELIDNLQRLDLCSHFKDCIAKILLKIYEAGNNIAGDDDEFMEKDLHLTSLKFRILRQHGFHVPEEVFCSFMDEEGSFKASVGEDVRGLVSLYEASFLSMEGERILDLAKDFSYKQLTRKLENMKDDEGVVGVAEQVKHALELPLHWRMQKLEALWFIQAYQNRSDANLHLLQLAKLDFNMVQATYQLELKRVSTWYRETGLPEKLSFARHRLAECFMWAMGFIPGSHLGKSREILTKIAVLITIIDDIYDVYGTLDELQLFTDTIERWDINSLDRLPEYMRICFLALFNSANELAYHILRDQGFNVISNLRRLWGELSRAYYLEARWFHSGYFPTTNEYLNTAWVSISGPLLLFYAYFSTTNSINKEELHRLEQHSRWPSMVLRLADDLGTSSDEIKRGDVPKSVQCFMNDTGCCEEEAREHVKQLIEAALKRMNREMVMEKALKDFGETAMNLGRISLCMYQHGDGFGLPHAETKNNMVSLLVRPSLCVDLDLT